VETIRYCYYVDGITIASKPIHNHRNLLGGILSYMVDKEAVKGDVMGKQLKLNNR
jgi:hypothetical protein